MDPTSIVAALVTVLARNLVDRLIYRAPVVRPVSFFPQSVGLVVVSGMLYMLYNRLRYGDRHSKNNRPHLKTPISHNKRRRRLCSNSWFSRRFRRSRSKCTQDLLQTAKTTPKLKPNEDTSSGNESWRSTLDGTMDGTLDSNQDFGWQSGSESPPSSNSTKKDDEDGTIDGRKGDDETRQVTPISLYSIVSTNDDLDKNNVSKKRDDQSFRGHGDCNRYQRELTTPTGKRRKRKQAHKTRSGKTYSHLE